ncbi:DNA polymerase Y family protein [Stackebrandtia nassauensis]|uniref:Nucleotidyltransferase/DNA polymerase involved in DNA repair-like protein n=1 Tax=Stackebrandtia nassauensis (strain DSM 44728 / CIP 108903 / NRRL B-16338 / NBRC 102104 / LLR-40K-21) TaxID=446470 RepID=D3Q9D8_STANL|nr:DNA polymerase Y family protein [Stackebrandtia nassauensis]ADD42620.1 Nucleotidyltransferase/DNA polymerase involved in DNA repair-like protein [Stackebrandtia nassauensis DSM 44728]
MRALVVWCPDWPVIAACRSQGLDETDPVAVVIAHRVSACSATARRTGVEVGMRRRDAAAVCPDLRLLAADPDAEAAGFEPVIAALEELVPAVQVLRPGWCGLPAKGPSGWYGDEEAAAETIVEYIAQLCDLEARVGIADGFWPASVAAVSGAIVPTGHNAQFLADRNIGLLGLPPLVELLRRLGINTLGAFAALPRDAIAERLGTVGLRAHARTRGHDERLPAPRTPPVDLDVFADYDEPLDRVDTAAFAARTLAEQLRATLAARELACTRLVIEAITAQGTGLRRVWRHRTVLRASDVADRVRWQLDGWLTHGGTGAIVHLRLSPEGIVDASALQDGLWGQMGDGLELADGSATKVQDLFGPEAVLHPVPQGGRNLDDRIAPTVWNQEPLPTDPVNRPWPDSYPAPYPHTVYPAPPRVRLETSTGEAITVSGRGVLSGSPAHVVLPNGRRLPIQAWAGPHPLDERWWDPARAHRAARLQLLLEDGRAVVLVRSEEVWRMEAGYD